MRLAAVLALAVVSACGPLVENTDRPTGITLGGGAPIAGDGGVSLVEAAPANGVEVEGISCRNKLWDPAPTNQSAIDTMRREAAAAGYNAVHLVSVGPAGNALLMNCWSAIRATGLAFNQ